MAFDIDVTAEDEATGKVAPEARVSNPPAQMSAGRTFDEADAETMAQGAIALAKQMGLDLSASHDVRMEMVVDRLNNAATRIIEAGLLLKSVKAECDHGEYLQKLERYGVTRQRASEITRYADFVTALPPKDRTKIAQLPKKKVLALAAADPELVEEICSEQGELDLDEIASMSLGELRGYVRKLKRGLANESAGRQNAETKLRLLQPKTQLDPAGSEYPQSVVRARMESSALSDQAIACLQSIDQIARGMNTASDLGAQNGERQANLKAALGPLAVNLAGVRAVLEEIHAALSESWGAYLPAGIEQTPMLSDEERERVAAMRGSMLGLIEAERNAREASRLQAGKQKRGPGRPRKEQSA